jgi:hypothetical protein
MKKSNRQRDMLLQKKRTKRNQSRKGKTYNPHKFQEPVANVAEKDVIAL